MDYRYVRKLFIEKRTEELLSCPGFSAAGNWRRSAKGQACREFDDFMSYERALAVEASHKKDDQLDTTGENL